MDITIVIAIYKPNIKWLCEELQSISEQTFQSFSVIAWNDCPSDEFDYNTLFQKHLGLIPFKIIQGQRNLGSNKVFEKLTQMVHTPYIAYCDQDDIWLPQKLGTLIQTIKQEKVSLVCSDMYIIDGNSNITAKSITEVRPHHVFYHGNDMFQHIVTRNFVAGCTVLMETAEAQKAVPFPVNFCHDHWLAIWSALHGGVHIVQRPLIKYRIYGGNQTSILKNVYDKQSYYHERIERYQLKIQELWRRLKDDMQMTESIRQNLITKLQWAEARKNYFNNRSLQNFFKLYRFRQESFLMTWFELLLPMIPNCVFSQIIRNIQKGKI